MSGAVPPSVRCYDAGYLTVAAFNEWLEHVGPFAAVSVALFGKPKVRVPALSAEGDATRLDAGKGEDP